MENFNEALENNVEAKPQFSGTSEKSHSSPEGCCENIDEETNLPMNSDREKSGPFVDKEETSDDIADKERINLLDNENSPPTSYITMKIVAFLNARHYMVFADKKGKTHGHSWQLQAEARVPVKYDSFVKFEDLDKSLNKLLAPYQRNILNEVFPFDIIEPLTENISVYFFNSLSEVLENIDVDLVKLTVWENPTKGIEITERLPQYFNSFNTEPITQIRIEAAASKDNPDPIVDVKQENVLQQVNKPCTGMIAETGIVENTSSREILPKSELQLKKKLTILQEAGNAPNWNNDKEFDASEKLAISYRKIAFSILALIGVGLWAYWPLLSAPLYHAYPWGADTWGHLYRAEFLYQSFLSGNYFPNFTSDWYNGSELFRYWPPLSYYVIAGINLFCKNIFIAGNYYIFLCAVIGGLGWLLFTRRIGFWPALMAGLVWIIWPDNLKIALAEGNLPRILTTAILPLVFWSFLNILQVKGRKLLWFMFANVLLIHILVLCHAMMAAIYCVCFTLFAIFMWAFGGTSLKRVINSILVITIGVGSSSWWLLPSLKGGLTGMSKTAAAAPVEFIGLTTGFNPLYRFIDPGAHYWGISLLLVIVLAIFLWRSKPPWVKSLFVCGTAIIILTLPAFAWIQQILPLSHILWPLRFSTFASFALIACAFTFSSPYMIALKWGQRRKIGLIIVALFSILLIDSYFSMGGLITSRTQPYHTLECAEQLKNHEGWRVANLDFSSLASPPSYMLSFLSHREQVFGWAWQGATTSQNIMLLNTALEYDWYPFLFRELSHLGATDLMVNDKFVKKPAGFKQMALAYGYSKEDQIADISIWRKNVAPYMWVREKSCLVIGTHASTYAMLFPSVEIGKSNQIDSYSIEELSNYKTLILTGAEWRHQDEAEKRVKAFAKAGGKVIVDYTGFPLDVLAKQPKFLGVYAEPVVLKHRLSFNTPDGTITCDDFAEGYSTWKTYAPQALDEVLISYKYYGNSAAAWGYKEIESNKIWFIGGNPAYHAFLTADPVAVKLLEQLLGLSRDYEIEKNIPLQNYQRNSDGYSFSYSLKWPQEVIIPISGLEGLQAYVDGQPVMLDRCENLVCMVLPGGKHTVDFKLFNPPIYRIGLYVSISIGILFVFGLGFLYWFKLINSGALRSDLSLTDIESR